jgi:hypothetical protein
MYSQEELNRYFKNIKEEVKEISKLEKKIAESSKTPA